MTNAEAMVNLAFNTARLLLMPASLALSRDLTWAKGRLFRLRMQSESQGGLAVFSFHAIGNKSVNIN